MSTEPRPACNQDRTKASAAHGGAFRLRALGKAGEQTSDVSRNVAKRPKFLEDAQDVLSDSHTEVTRLKPLLARSIPAKVRATLYLPWDVLEEARDAAVHLAGYPARLTLAALAENALRAELQRLKDRYNAGKDFPRRDANLKGGRPIAA